jgi:hypothetical protein
MPHPVFGRTSYLNQQEVFWSVIRQKKITETCKIYVQDARDQKNKTSILELEDTDSESTMKDIEDNLEGVEDVQQTSASRRTPRKHRKPSQQRGETNKVPVVRDEGGGSAVGLVNFSYPAGVASAVAEGPGGLSGIAGDISGVAGGISSVPNALHFRFMAEMHQFEAVNEQERFILELEQIKRSTFDSQRCLAEMQAEIRGQRRQEEQQRGQQVDLDLARQQVGSFGPVISRVGKNSGLKKNQPSGVFRVFWVFLGVLVFFSFLGFFGFLLFFYTFAQEREFLGFFQVGILVFFWVGFLLLTLVISYSASSQLQDKIKEPEPDPKFLKYPRSGS